MGIFISNKKLFFVHFNFVYNYLNKFNNLTDSIKYSDAKVN